MLTHSPLKKTLSYSLVFLLASLIWWAFVTDFSFFLPTLQFPIYGDATGSDFFLPSTSAKIFADNESFPFFLIQTQRLGAPFGFSFGDFPTPDNIMHLETWLISRVVKDPFAIMNLLYILSFGLCAVSFFAVCKRLVSSSLVALGGALLFTFLPFHFGRFWHTFLANYFLVPWMLLYILNFENAFQEPLKKRVSFKNILILFIFSAGGGYYLYFFCILLAAIALYSFFSKRRWEIFSHLTVTYVLVGFFFFLNLAPTLWFQKTHGKNETPMKRNRKEVVFFSLKPTNLIFPNQNNRLPPLQEIAKQSPKFGAKPFREGFGESLGLFGAFGLLASLFFCFRRNSNPLLKKIGFLNLAALLSFSTGGFACHLSIWVFPFFRSIDRASIFIAGLSFFALAVWIEKKATRYSTHLRNLVLICLFTFGIYEAIPLNVVIARFNEQAQKRFDFFKTLEKNTPPGTKVLQLPFISFPEGEGFHYLGSYHHLAPFLETKSMQFSFGLYKGRPEHDQIKKISKDLDFKKIEELYQGILVERIGYEDGGKKIEAKIFQRYQTTPIVSPDKDKAYFPIYTHPDPSN